MRTVETPVADEEPSGDPSAAGASPEETPDTPDAPDAPDAPETPEILGG